MPSETVIDDAPRLLGELARNDLKAWRTAKGWSLARTAEELGRAENSVINYERAGEVPKTVQLAMEALDMRELLTELALAIGLGNDRRIVASATKLVRRRGDA